MQKQRQLAVVPVNKNAGREAKTAGESAIKKELMLEKKQMYKSCINGEIDSSKVWKPHRSVCINCCENYRERREIGIPAYLGGSERNGEVINSQTESCLKYGHKEEYHWFNWLRARVEERFGKEKIWRRVE